MAVNKRIRPKPEGHDVDTSLANRLLSDLYSANEETRESAARALFELYLPTAQQLGRQAASRTADGRECDASEREHTAATVLFLQIDRRTHPHNHSNKALAATDSHQFAGSLKKAINQAIRENSVDEPPIHLPVTAVPTLHTARRLQQQLPDRLINGRYGLHILSAALSLPVDETAALLSKPIDLDVDELAAPSPADEPAWFDPDRVVDRLGTHNAWRTLIDLIRDDTRPTIVQQSMLEGASLRTIADQLNITTRQVSAFQRETLAHLARAGRELGLPELFDHRKSNERYSHDPNIPTIDDAIGIALAAKHSVAGNDQRQRFISAVAYCTRMGSYEIQQNPGLGHLLLEANTTPPLNGYLEANSPTMWGEQVSQIVRQSASEYGNAKALVGEALERAVDTTAFPLHDRGIKAVLDIRQPYGDEELHRAVSRDPKTKQLLRDHIPDIDAVMKHPAQLRAHSLDI
jgi:hypothetical protein